MLNSIGNSSDPLDEDELIEEGKSWLKERRGILEMDFFPMNVNGTEELLDNIVQINVQGTKDLLGKIFDEIGFGQIPDELFKKLVLAWLCYPVNKLKTTDYFTKHQFFPIDVQNIYR